MAVIAMFVADAVDTNEVYSPCSDAKVQKGDGFTFGIAISSKENLYPGQGPQLSPCDKRLGLSQNGAQLAVFRPKVDEISLLTVNRNSSNTVCNFIIYVISSIQKQIAALIIFYKNINIAYVAYAGKFQDFVLYFSL